MTYVYAEQTAVVGPLAAFAEPHSYDLCENHAVGLTAPRGWDLVRHDGEFGPPPPTNDDLVALADAVREAARPITQRQDQESSSQIGSQAVGSSGVGSPPMGRRGHLRVIPPER